MLGLPASTKIHICLPKESLFEHFDLNEKQKAFFNSDIHTVSLVHEISISPDEAIYLCHICLHTPSYNPKNIELFSKLDQKLVFLLQFEDAFRLAIFDSKLFESNWAKVDDLVLSFDGDTIDEVWKHLVLAIGSFSLTEGKDLKEQITFNTEQEKILKKIAALEKKAYAERQPRRKMELVAEAKKLRNLISGQ